MKIAVIGGGGVRTPLLVGGAAGRAQALGIEVVSLTDPAPESLRLMTLVCRALLERAGHPFRLEATADWRAAVAGADFVVTSLRPGGLEARTWDERIPPIHGIPGNETTGPGGWALALRSIPFLLDYARGIQRLAPGAWLINFSNPAGLLTQAVLTGTGLRTVGICDGPGTLAEGIRRALGLAGDGGFVDYLGLNHLGWVRAVWDGGRDLLPSLLDQSDRLAGIYPQPLFSPEEIRALGLIPHEYLYLYYHSAEVAAEQRRVGVTRAEQLAAINAELWAALGRAAERQDADAALAA